MTIRRSPVLISASFIVLFLVVTVVFSYARSKTAPAFSNQITVFMQPGSTEGQIGAIVKAVNGHYIRSLNLPGSPSWLLEVPWVKSEVETRAVVQKLMSYPEVQSAEVNEFVSIDKFDPHP